MFDNVNGRKSLSWFSPHPNPTVIEVETEPGLVGEKNIGPVSLGSSRRDLEPTVVGDDDALGSTEPSLPAFWLEVLQHEDDFKPSVQKLQSRLSF